MTLDPSVIASGLLEAAPDAILVIDNGGRIVLVNAHAEEMFGYSRAEMLGSSVEMLVPESRRYAHERHRDVFAQAPQARPMGKDLDLLGCKKDGTELPIEVSLSPFSSEQGDLTIAIARDISGRKQTQARLLYLSTHDSLTGLYNRAFFVEEHLRLAKGRRFPVSVVIMDVDGLKRVNDEFGHAAGDELLRRTAAVAQRTFRGEDVVARLGGDEFGMLLPEVDEAGLVQVIERIYSVVAEDNREHPEQAALSISAGGATAMDGAQLSVAIREADRRMYEAKRSRPTRSAESGPFDKLDRA
jgi:diguanylate cyclase (GGDEF)-like protein/PAS domain S-box-containing protein